MQYHSALYVYIYVTFTTVPYKEKPDIISICFSMLSFVFDFSVRICSRTLESFSWSLISSSAFKVVSAFSLAGSCVLASRSSVGIIVSLLLFNFSTCNFVLFLSAVLIDLFFCTFLPTPIFLPTPFFFMLHLPIFSLLNALELLYLIIAGLHI
ncbi:Fyv5p [Saccharomyces cerevisiae YJM1463]|nr:Fyv5p [Saccharomyces cerevisiae YJM1463]